jgi:two-component system response regulator FixJ
VKSLQTVHLLDNDPAVSRKLEHFLQHFGYTVTRHTSASDLPEAVNDADFSVVLADHAAVATAGLQLQAELAAGKLTCPVMFMAENADVKTSVQLLRDGAADFLEKPLDDSRLLHSLDAAFSQVDTLQRDQQRREQAQARFDTLTPREQEIMQQIVRGTSNRALATRQEVSVRTIKVTPFQGYDQNGGHQPARAGAARRPAGRD